MTTQLNKVRNLMEAAGNDVKHQPTNLVSWQFDAVVGNITGTASSLTTKCTDLGNPPALEIDQAATLRKLTMLMFELARLYNLTGTRHLAVPAFDLLLAEIDTTKDAVGKPFTKASIRQNFSALIAPELNLWDESDERDKARHRAGSYEKL